MSTTGFTRVERLRAECPDDGSRYVWDATECKYRCETEHADGWHLLASKDVLLDEGERVQTMYDDDGVAVLWIVRDAEVPVPPAQQGYCSEPCAGVGVMHPYHGIGVPPASPPRTYVVGLPVVITVQEDGTVTYEVDTSEAAREVGRDDDTRIDRYTDDEVESDVLAIEADLRRRNRAGQ